MNKLCEAQDKIKVASLQAPCQTMATQIFALMTISPASNFVYKYIVNMYVLFQFSHVLSSVVRK